MALTATLSWVPFRSMPSRITWASSLRASAERTRSLLFTCSWMLGLTSSDTTEATELPACQKDRPHTSTKAAATARAAQRRLVWGRRMGTTAVDCVWGPQDARIRSRALGAACSTAVRSRSSSS